MSNFSVFSAVVIADDFANLFTGGHLLSLLTILHILISFFFFTLVRHTLWFVTLKSSSLIYILKLQFATRIQKISTVIVSILVGLLGIHFIFGVCIFIPEKEVVFKIEKLVIEGSFKVGEAFAAVICYVRNRFVLLRGRSSRFCGRFQRALEHLFGLCDHVGRWGRRRYQIWSGRRLIKTLLVKVNRMFSGSIAHSHNQSAADQWGFLLRFGRWLFSSSSWGRLQLLLGPCFLHLIQI